MAEAGDSVVEELVIGEWAGVLLRGGQEVDGTVIQVEPFVVLRKRGVDAPPGWPLPKSFATRTYDWHVLPEVIVAVKVLEPYE